MSVTSLVAKISTLMPQINHRAMKYATEEAIDNSHEFPDAIFREAIKIVPANIEYLGYTILGAKQQAKHEMDPRTAKPKISTCAVTESHLRLVSYRFRFNGEYYEAIMSVPYMHNGMLHVNGKRSIVNKVLLEKTFFRQSDNGKDGIQFTTTQLPIPFNRKSPVRIKSLTSFAEYQAGMITTKLFSGQITGKCGDTTIVLYLMAKFGAIKTFRKMGISPDDLFFVDHINRADKDQFEYFSALNFTIIGDETPPLLLKVRKNVLENEATKKFVVNLLKVMGYFDFQDVNNVYDADATTWKVMLGFTLSAERSMPKACSLADANLNSVDVFIDPASRRRLAESGIIVTDTYDLMAHVFVHLDYYLVNLRVEDLYNYRLDSKSGILIEFFAKRIFNAIYELAHRSNIQAKDVNTMIKRCSRKFTTASSRKDDDQVIVPQEIVGDNLLLCGGLTKVRVGGKPEHRLDPSWLAVESIGAFGGNTVNRTGYINPYIPTDPDSEFGAIMIPSYAEEVARLSEILPR
jgi:hypothetical protein